MVGVHGGQGESLVPPHTRGSVSLPLSLTMRWMKWRALFLSPCLAQKFSLWSATILRIRSAASGLEFCRNHSGAELLDWNQGLSLVHFSA